jgi:tetratricopeptide (TPR) repeat protein
MRIRDLNALFAKAFSSRRSKGRQLGPRFWLSASIVFAATATVGFFWLTNSYADESSEVKPVRPNTETGVPETVARDHSEIEAQVLKLLAAGDQSKAEHYLNEAVKRFPSAMKLTVLLAGEKSAEAKQLLQAQADELHQAQRTFFLFAACTRSRFDIESSAVIFQAVSAMNPSTPSGKCALYMHRLDTNPRRLSTLARVEQELVNLRKLIETYPDDVMIRWMLAVQCRTWNYNAEGAELYKQILDQWNPGPVLVHQTYANLLDSLGRYDDALIERRQAVKMEPSSWSYDGLANTLNHLWRFQEANEAHAMAIQLDPERSSYWSNWGLCMIGLGQDNEAIQKCQRALELDPQNWRGYQVWGTALEAQGKKEEALEKYKQALALSPGSFPLRRSIYNLEAKLAK